MVMRRAIAGVRTDKRARGEVIELAAEKKAALAVKGALAEREVWPGKLAFATGITIDKVDHSPKGNPLKKKWANNTYRATGKMKVHLRDIANDQMSEPKVEEFKIEFCDCLDREGLPNLTIDKFEIR